jgi:hypothetical protein
VLGRRPDRVFAALVVCAYLPVALFAIWHHEMWRDELHCWLVARDSPWPWDVVHNRRYDGQPPLWYLLLWVLEKLTHDPLSMQIVHVGLATAVVWVFASRAPFSRPVRALFPFGYFLAYEYVALSRCYGLALLLALLICDNHERRFTRPWRTGLLLAALALTTTVSTVVALAYTATLLIDAVELKRRGSTLMRRAFIPIGVSLAGALAAALCAWPPADSTVTHVGWPHHLPDDTAATRLLVALVPIPHDDFFFWNSNALMWWEPFRGVAVYFALAAAAWIVVLLSRRRSAWVLFAVGAFGLWVLFAFIYGGDVRHHGFFFVLLLMGAWLAARSRPRQGFRTRATRATLVAILLAHVAGTPIALYWDARYVFPSGKRAAEALEERGLSDALLVAEMDYPATAMLGQLGGDAFAYTPRTGRAFSFVKWTRDRKWDPTDEQTLAYCRRLGEEKGRDVVLVMNRPLLPELVDGTRVVRLAELYDSMIEEENFYLYRVARG